MSRTWISHIHTWPRPERGTSDIYIQIYIHIHTYTYICRYIYNASCPAHEYHTHERVMKEGLQMRHFRDLRKFLTLLYSISTYRVAKTLHTGWWRLIGCLKLQVIFRKRATNYRAFLYLLYSISTYKRPYIHMKASCPAYECTMVCNRRSSYFVFWSHGHTHVDILGSNACRFHHFKILMEICQIYVRGITSIQKKSGGEKTSK